MNILHDRSYISEYELDFVARGYRHEDLHSIRFCFVYTPEEGTRNKALLESVPLEMREEILTSSTRLRSASMKPVMEAIASELVCFQYNKERKLAFNDTSWDLYFWCGYDKCLPDGDNFSYFTLSFNEEHTPEQRQEICDKVLKLVQSRFAQHPNLEVSIQYTTRADEEKIEQTAKAALPALLGKPCMYKGHQGKIVQTDAGVFFKKKHARTKGYVLKAADILKISWDAA